MLGRDHMGQRAVFYHKANNFLAFASEIKGLWALTEVPRKLLEEMIFRESLWNRWPEGETFYEGILSVMGGTIVVACQNGTLKSHRYWEPHHNHET